MSRPTKVVIGHRTYDIEWVREQDWLKQEDPSDNGVFWYERGVIRIRLVNHGMQISRDALREILCHEILHGCWAHANMRNTHAVDPTDSEALEEWTVGGLSYQIIQVLTDNPEVAAYIRRPTS